MKRLLSPIFVLLKIITFFVLIAGFCCIFALPLAAQELDTQPQNDPIKSIRSDVGIVGLSVNLDWWNSFRYLGSNTLQSDTNHEIEIVFRDVRMLNEHFGVGFMVVGSLFIDDSNFGFGGWGVGPVFRGYPFETDRFTPYLQAHALLGNGLGLGKLADTINEGQEFRIRLGMQAGIGIRLTNSFGFFVEFGPMWESSSLFKADAFVWQLNIGIDLYRFKR